MDLKRKLPKGMMLYFALIALAALGQGFSDSIFSNYFKDAYGVDAALRGLIELPRESPGMLCMFVIMLCAPLGDLKINLIAQGCAFVGLLVLGLSTPSFNWMLVFLFINSLGLHLFMPLQDSIGMSLSEKDQVGKRMGQYASVRSVVGFFTAIVVFIGFRTQLFSFTTPIKPVFLLGALGYLLAIAVSVRLLRLPKNDQPSKKIKFLFRKQYRYYYALAILQGVQKQIAYVYGSWVIIEILKKGADVMSLLYIAANLIGIFFLQMLGRWLDRFGIKRMMYVDALSFVLVYAVYGFVVMGLSGGALQISATSVWLVCGLFVLDRMSMQCGIVKAVYLRSIAWSGNDVTATLSTGTSLDHIVALIAAPLCGLVWVNWGPQWVFFIAALFSLGNVYVAWRIKPEEEAQKAEVYRANIMA